MKKILVILVTVLLLFSFGALVYYALTYSRGIPTTIEKTERVILEAQFIDKEINLAQGISQEIWDSISSKEIKLMYQVMVLPWPKVVVPEIFVKAFHNQQDIYFYFSWKDDTQDTEHKINKFSDACAIMFPMDDKIQPSSIMMGFIGKANIWQWKASQDREYWIKEQRAKSKEQKLEACPVRNLAKDDELDISNGAYADYYYPFEEEEIFPVSKTIPKSAVNDLMAIRVGTVTPKEKQNIAGRGFWQEGNWNVVFKRAIKAVDSEIDAVFSAIGGSAEGGNPGKKMLCAFGVWNGSKGDRGGRKSISDWVELVLK